MEKETKKDDLEISWDESKGSYKQISKTKKQMGKTSRAKGARFELKVREEFKKTNWILDKWTNNVDLAKQEVVPAKRKYNPFKKMLVVGTGFPDFIGIKNLSKYKKPHEEKYNIMEVGGEEGVIELENSKDQYDVIGIEVKLNGFLSQEEKSKCKFYLQNKIFSKIYIATAVKVGRKVEVKLIDFQEKYKKKYEDF